VIAPTLVLPTGGPGWGIPRRVLAEVPAPTFALRPDNPHAAVLSVGRCHHLELPRGLPSMAEMEVVIQFNCCHCQDQVTARLKCSGKGVSEGPHVVAGAHLACPTCDQVNQVCFELSGLVLD